MILRNWASASSMPAGVQRRHMSPLCQCLTLRLTRRTVSIIDSHGFVEASMRLSRPRTPRRVTVSVSSMPSRSLGAVDDRQRALLDVQAALEEVGEQRTGDGGVLGRAVPEPERMLDTVGVD